MKSERKITVSVNGEERRVVSDLSVEELLNLLGVKGPSVAVARNQAIIPRSDYSSATLEEGDQIEIIHAVGGGLAERDALASAEKARQFWGQNRLAPLRGVPGRSKS